MRTSSKLSSFAIAAIVIMTAASSSFAQAQAIDTRAEVSSSAVTPGNDLLAVNSKRAVAGERIMGESMEAKSAAEMPSVTKRPLLSSASFNVANHSSQFVKVDSNQILDQQFKLAIAPANTTDNQFNENSRKKVEFVPSRGQKLPDNKVTY